MNWPAAINSPGTRARTAIAFTLGLTGAFVALGCISRARTNPHLALTFAVVAAGLLGWQLALWFGPGRKASSFAWDFNVVRSHYVQALLQLSIYAYWGWYWRNVYAEAPLILAQVVFLYVFDALLTWSRGQTWRLGFGPLPIIFSTNLFMWFRDDWFGFQFLMVALGVLGKQFIRWRRDGKETHIFNPSALGLTVISLVLICSGTSGITWGQEIAITQGRPPHLYTEIFLCGLVVQYFFSVTLLTFSAAAALGLLMIAWTGVTGVYLFIDSNIPIAVFLGLHLLMTDPATTPRSSLGKIMFGSLYGGGVLVAFILLQAGNAPAFYDKLVLVPILNLLAPLLDRLAARGWAGKIGRWEAVAGPRKVNLACMAGWAALFLIMRVTGFVEAPHPGATIGFWKKAAEEHRPRAAQTLRLLLSDFERRDLDDPAEPVAAIGASGPLNRAQSLGILCNQVASIYAEGKVVPPDPGKAVRYFQKACELGNEEGCANLVIECSRTNVAGTQPEIDRALATLEASSGALSNSWICCLVANAYDTGQGRPLDKARARQFYEKGAALGNLTAWKNLARMQLAGEGGPPDHASAALWLQKAADAQDGASCLNLARLYHTGDGVPKDEQRATALLQKACDLDVEPACNLLRQSRR